MFLANREVTQKLTNYLTFIAKPLVSLPCAKHVHCKKTDEGYDEIGKQLQC